MTDYDTIEHVRGMIEGVLSRMGIIAQVDYEDSLLNGLVYNISSRDSRMLIGQHGQTLHALEVIARALVAKQSQYNEPFRFSIDVDDYKRKRQWVLKETVKQAVEKIKHSKGSVVLDPMPHFERKFVHAYVQEQFPHIKTASTGEDPYRKIVLSPAY